MLELLSNCSIELEDWSSPSMTTQECRGASYQATEHFAHSMASPAFLVHSSKGRKLIQTLPVSKAIVLLLGTIESKTTRRGRNEACNWCIVFISADSKVHAAEEETRFSGFGDADENDLQVLKATVMMLMNTIPTFITNIMSLADKAPDGATTACAGHSATASVNDSSRPISWCFLNYVVSLMVEWTKTQISFYELVELISSNTHLAVAGTSRWNWLFEDCSTLFIFSRYFLIGHVSHKIHTWAKQKCWT